MTARGEAVSPHRTAEQKTPFQQQLDAAQKMSWQGRVESQRRLEADIANSNKRGVVPVVHRADGIKVDDSTVLLVENIPEDSSTQEHLLKTFGAFGTVTGCVVHQLHKGEPPPTWALLAFETQEEAAACLSHSCPDGRAAPDGHVGHSPGGALTDDHSDSHMRCTKSEMTKWLQWDQGGMMADAWLRYVSFIIVCSMQLEFPSTRTLDATLFTSTT